MRNNKPRVWRFWVNCTAKAEVFVKAHDMESARVELRKMHGFQLFPEECLELHVGHEYPFPLNERVCRHDKEPRQFFLRHEPEIREHIAEFGEENLANKPLRQQVEDLTAVLTISEAQGKELAAELREVKAERDRLKAALDELVNGFRIETCGQAITAWDEDVFAENAPTAHAYLNEQEEKLNA